MSVDSLRGHEIVRVNGVWVYADTLEPTVETYKKRPCGHCGQFNTPEDHDACLGTLPDVINACCGHGQVRDAYVQFPDMSMIRCEAAIAYVNKVKEDAN